MELIVYLAGEIHSPWRQEIEDKARERNLPLKFVAPHTTHERSDDIGEAVLGKQPGNYYRDEAGSSINNLRTHVLMQKADVVVALFGEQYKQWNTAMDASTAVALNKPLILVRPEAFIHPLKELSNRANVTVESVDQVIDILAYIFE